MAFTYSKTNEINLLNGQAKYDAINTLNRPNKDAVNDILLFKHYFKGFELEKGKDGPEEVQGKAYLTVYHYMEYNGINPHNYNILAIGESLSHLTNSDVWCKYKKHDYIINKYDYFFIKKYQNIFNEHKL